MKRILPWIGWSAGLLLGFLLLVILLLFIAANTQMVRSWLEQKVAESSAGQISLTGLSGRFPDGLRLKHLELRDETGPWLVVEDFGLDWSPLRLLSGEARIDRLEAGHIILDRLPSPSAEEEQPSEGFVLPVAVRLQSLRVGRLDLGEPVIGKIASLSIDGLGHLVSMAQGEVTLSVKRLDGEGTYALQGRYEHAQIHAGLKVSEPAQGLIASYAGIEELDALTLDLGMEGPLTALQARLNLAFGPLQATAQGRLNFDSQHIDTLVLSATAPAMQPRPDVSWQAIALDAQASGPFTTPSAKGKLAIENFSAAGTLIRALSLNLQGDAGQVGLDGEIAGLKIPGSKPDLLEAAAVKLQADLRLDTPDRPLQFSLKHPLIAAQGQASLGADLKGAVAFNLPDLQPLAALGGQDVRGKAGLNVRVVKTNEATALDADGLFSVTGGQAPWPKLVGDKAKLAIALALNGPDIKLSRMNLEAKALALSAQGRLASGKTDVQWTFALSDLAAVMAEGSGRLVAQGAVKGPLDNLAINADLDGEVATRQFPHGPIKAQIALEGVPKLPTGHVTARGIVGGAPLDLAIATQAPADGSMQVTLERADWKSAHGAGGLNLPKGAAWPLGKMDLQMGRLEDLRPLLGQPLQGSVTLNLETVQRPIGPQALLKLEAHNAGLAATATAGQTRLDLAVSDPLKHPVFDGRLSLDGLDAGTVKGNSRLDLAGPLEALALHLSADAQTVRGSAKMDLAAQLDAPAQRLALTHLDVEWQRESLRLLAPAHVDFAKGLTVDHLGLGFAEATLDVAGQLSPKLDLTASLRNVSANLAKLADPALDAAGTLQADVRLTGSPARPFGSVAVEADGVQMRTGPGRGIPPAKLTANAQLEGTLAQIDTRLTTGRDLNLTVNGEVPLAPAGQFDLHAQGGVDLKILDPLLTADGRRVRGLLALDANMAGSMAEPQFSGTARVSRGEVQDFANSAHLTDLEALVEAHGEVIRLSKLTAKAGPGRILASGEVDLGKEGLPVDFTLAAQNARPLASDRLTVNLDSNLSLRGQLQGALTATGNIHIREAEIRIPERMPTNIAVLKVRRPGETPPPPPAPVSQQVIALNLFIDAPREIFVRGRGLDAELGGKIHLLGTAANPQPDGVFALRRGQFALAGQTLDFKKGEVGFNGGSLTNPSLNFLAKTTSGNVTANLAITGTANKPKISLSSIPELPQDEVLAQLLFGRAATSLSPLELAQIASALASLSGVTSGLGDPLESVRKGLGLDRLSVGASLEAGRYIAPGVYLGGKQGITGGNSQATVQIDITKGLKVEGSVGVGAPASGSASSSGANSVGVIYQYEY